MTTIYYTLNTTIKFRDPRGVIVTEKCTYEHCTAEVIQDQIDALQKQSEMVKKFGEKILSFSYEIIK